MAKASRIFRPSVRKRIAYGTAIRVLISYLWLNLKSKVLGKAYYERKIKELHVKNAARIKARVQELQGLFIKFGQLMSTLSNVLPKEFRTPLEDLQDHIQAKPYSEIEQTIEQELGQAPHLLFEDFEKTPLAAASIGQVHRATVNGRPVAVKIQHKNINTIARADIEILTNLVKLHGYFMNMQGLEHTYQQVRQMIEEELDYSQEATSMQTIQAQIAEAPELQVRVPRVYNHFSTSKVLTTEFIEGAKLGDINQLRQWGLDLEDTAKRLIELYCKMILVDGFYHADPHPGNIFITSQGTIALLDFGAVAHLSDQTKQAIPLLIEALIRNDTEATVGALRKLGFVGPDKASRKYVEEILDIFKEFVQEEVELDGLNFQNIKLNGGISSISNIISKIDLRKVSNAIKVPKDYILLNRAVVLLMGDVFLLAPDLNALDVVRPYMKKHVLTKDQNYTQLILNTFKNQVTTALSLPNDLSRFLKSASESDLVSEMRGINLGLQQLYRLGQQFLYGGLLVGMLYLRNANGLALSQELEWLTLIGVWVLGFLLVRDIWRGRG